MRAYSYVMWIIKIRAQNATCRASKTRQEKKAQEINWGVWFYEYVPFLGTQVTMKSQLVLFEYICRETFSSWERYSLQTVVRHFVVLIKVLCLVSPNFAKLSIAIYFIHLLLIIGVGDSRWLFPFPISVLDLEGFMRNITSIINLFT